MVQFTGLTVALALTSLASAQCGSGSPHATVTGSGSSFRATKGSTNLYSGSDYRLAIQSALDGISSGQRVSVMASGNLGANTIRITSGKTFEGCGTITAAPKSGGGNIEVTDQSGVSIPYLTMAGSTYFGMRFSGTKDLTLGTINFNLKEGMGIRFDRDRAANTNVKMGTITCNGGTSHCVETWNIDKLEIGSVVGKNVGECGLLIQKVTNANIGTVDCDNCAAGTGYAALRFANEAGKLNGAYPTNIRVNKVKARGGGRGIFCVSASGGAEIGTIDVANTGNNAILLENCYNVNIKAGTVNGGGEVRLAARTEFANSRDIAIALRVDGTTVRESPCTVNKTKWNLSGNGGRTICT
ncbi:parallel beta-helix repeat protein [Stemphylium lycopersici]|uniref:Parallel beta-helix repeat protein n=1 Tax=Stemphylium lycopersici TaxID=183478 RepID=A0A364N9L4_STELY|nr:parallel beta-helix repeat protein [Stemphylium lycopersici]RAR09342.1 parallel beta-helix repeat protein [Stemphylium lycopersici]RAR14034.1 parallel beta-helix repeat protein [Stemphylium lycopersici]